LQQVALGLQPLDHILDLFRVPAGLSRQFLELRAVATGGDDLFENFPHEGLLGVIAQLTPIKARNRRPGGV
jgi:hypothetical protein